MKLSRSKWLTEPREFCSGDFRKLQIELPEICSLNASYFKNVSAGKINLKPALKDVLDPMSFSLKPSEGQPA